METGYLKYNNKLVKVTILEKKSQHTTVETEDHELLCIPCEASVVIWPTKEMYEDYQKGHSHVWVDGPGVTFADMEYATAENYIKVHSK